MPDDLQLRRRLSAGHPHHPGDPRGLLGDRRAAGLTTGRRDADWESLWQSVGAGPARDAGAREAPAARQGEPAGGPQRLIVRTDGAARGNPGPASLGAVLIDASQPGALRPDAPAYASISEYLGIRTNNVAEYTGLLRALGLAEELGARQLDILLDSLLIVQQLQGRWRVKDAKLAPLHREALERLGRFERWTVRHVPRAQNTAADALCNQAIDRALAGGPPAVVVRPTD